MYKKAVVTGFFLLIGIGLLLYSTLLLSSGKRLLARDYNIKIVFPNVNGLHQGSSIRIAGVPIGQIKSIRLQPETLIAEVICSIEKDIRIPEDSLAIIKSNGLFGDKYIQITKGNATSYLSDGDELFESQSSLDFEDLLGKFIFSVIKS